MNVYKKAFAIPSFYIILIISAIGISLHYFNADPLDLVFDNQTDKLRNYIKPNRILVVSFWASWCVYCMHEMQTLKLLQQAHPELIVLGIQIDDGIPGNSFKVSSYPNVKASDNGTQIMRLYGNYSGGVPFILILHNQHKSTFLGETSLANLEQSISK